ncbi:sugar nucleotide-binding protein [Arthrobacter sp. GCM10027362]|uniref:sugar nucleotide-binding protein n=1 Tax=Arthrobacter sp. GCM10027362 TaxID=3273379 RepID=UPI003645CAF8
MQEASNRSDSYLASLRNLAAALPGTPRRVVFVSSTRVFEGRTGRRALTEVDTPAPVTPRGRTLRDGELLASELFDAHIVRPAGIYGPGREMLLRKVIEGTPVQYAKRTNRIHEADLVRTLQTLLLAEDPPRILHAVDQAPAALGEVVTYIAHQLGLSPPPKTQPDVASGTVLSGALLLTLLGTLQYPTFEAGYGHIIATRNEQASPRPDGAPGNS